MDATWFTAKCLYRAIHSSDEPRHEALGELRFFLIQAVDESSARERALAIALEQEHSYKNSLDDAAVHWKLEGVLNVKELFGSEWREGLEVYYEYLTESEMAALRQTI